MRLEAQVAVAYGVDLLCGDPRWFPHPVKFIGRFAVALEAPLRRAIRNARLAGMVAVLIIVGGTAALSWASVRLSYAAYPWLGDAVSILLLYTCFATRDLAIHARQVDRALAVGDLGAARKQVGKIVGRDTEPLDEEGVARATVESVAENTVDGITAPLFFAVLGGPVCAMAYKAVSTLDSTFGYKNEKYLHFGWASARLDDVAAWIPSRLTLPVIALAAALMGMRPWTAWKVGLRESGKHTSPNAGFSEAAFAGALGVQLGGPMYKHGKLLPIPFLGEPKETMERRQIGRSVLLMLTTSLLMAVLLAGLRVALLHGLGK